MDYWLCLKMSGALIGGRFILVPKKAWKSGSFSLSSCTKELLQTLFYLKFMFRTKISVAFVKTPRKGLSTSSGVGTLNFMWPRLIITFLASSPFFSMKNLEEIKDKFRLLWVIQIFDLQIKLQFTETRVESDVIEWPWTILTRKQFVQFLPLCNIGAKAFLLSEQVSIPYQTPAPEEKGWAISNHSAPTKSERRHVYSLFPCRMWPIKKMNRESRIDTLYSRRNKFLKFKTKQ